MAWRLHHTRRASDNTVASIVDISSNEARVPQPAQPVEFVRRLTGSSEAVRQLEQEIEWASRCDAKVLITGESGVGKEVVARLIHDRSIRRRYRMHAINCAGIPDSLLESELFGHERGSFTGAYRDKSGLLELAHAGTLFMDEVCEMSLRMQVLLLRFLETGEIQRVGSDGPRGHVDVRVIAATNRDVAQRIAAAEFREDLFYRLNVIHLRVPPLRERPEDIPELVDFFLGQFGLSRGGPLPKLAPDVRERLMRYPWPGNIRELRNVVERTVLRVTGDTITLEDLPPQFWASLPVPMPAAGSSPDASAAPAPSPSQAMFDRMTKHGECFWSVVHEPFMARDLTRHDVRETVRLGLEQTKGSYRLLVELFNIQADEYKRFLNFLRTFNCHLPFHGFRNQAEPPASDSGAQRTQAK
jgi:transcriptional regulator with PAS, ATPase and Fis domain